MGGDVNLEFIQPIELLRTAGVIPEWTFVGATLMFQHVPLQFVRAKSRRRFKRLKNYFFFISRRINKNHYRGKEKKTNRLNLASQ